MKLLKFYNNAVKFGAELDPRTGGSDFYPDTAILYGKADTRINKILIGIDIEVGELLLADKLRKEEGLDLVVSHHPEGRAWAVFYEVMRLQIDLLAKAGIPRKVAEELLEERKLEVERKVLPHNHMRSVDVAKLLDLPFICIHTPADNHAANYVEKLMRRLKPKRVRDIVDILMELPEYKDARRQNAGPRVILGNPNRPAGNIFMEMTGGTEGSKEVFDKLYKAGVRTLICMHLSEEHFKKVKDANLNVVIAGHISSDNLGLNLIMDKLEKEEKFSITCCSGFRRFSRG